MSQPLPHVARALAEAEAAARAQGPERMDAAAVLAAVAALPEPQLPPGFLFMLREDPRAAFAALLVSLDTARWARTSAALQAQADKAVGTLAAVRDTLRAQVQAPAAKVAVAVLNTLIVAVPGVLVAFCTDLTVPVGAFLLGFLANGFELPAAIGAIAAVLPSEGGTWTLKALPLMAWAWSGVE